MVLYDRAFNKENNLTRVIAHEFAHELYRQMSDNERFDYAKSAEWGAVLMNSLANPHFYPKRDGFVEEDGKDSITEDFANNIEYYLFNQPALKAKTPKVYQWIYNKFGDKFKIGGAKK